MNVLALDLSLTATGVCTAEGASTLRPKTTGVERLAWYEDRVRDLLYPFHPDASGRPDVAVVEDLPFGHNNAAGPLGMLHGVIRLLCYRYEVPVALVIPASLKKYATGKGNATKPDMRMALYKRAGIDCADDNQVDAWWLWAMTLDHYGHPEVDLPAVQRACMDKVDWPELVTA